MGVWTCLGGREGGVGEQRGRWGRITLRRRLGRGGCRGVAAAPTLAVFCKDGTVIYLATSTFNLVLSPLALSHPRCHGTLLLQTRHGAAPASKIVFHWDCHVPQLSHRRLPQRLPDAWRSFAAICLRVHSIGHSGPRPARTMVLCTASTPTTAAAWGRRTQRASRQGTWHSCMRASWCWTVGVRRSCTVEETLAAAQMPIGQSLR